MKIALSVPEFLEVCKAIQKKPERIFKMLRTEVKETVGGYLSQMMETELTHFLGRGPYERREGSKNYRNGSYHRNFTLKKTGEVDIKVPRDRESKFRSQVLPRSKRYEDELRKDVCLMFLGGISPRSLSMLSSRLLGRKISPSEVSKVNKELIEAVERWRTRDLSAEKVKYLFIDGVCFRMRIDGSIENVSVLVVIGVTEEGTRLVLALQSGDKESASAWRELFKDLKRRGLDSQNVKLGIMDGLTGLEKVFKEEFSRARIQRCQLHLAKNVLTKVPRKLKKRIADEVRSIFYASCKAKAMEFFSRFKERWERELPSAVKCLENSLEASLTFFNFPQEEWISLRTTNIIERLNKEFKRRTKPMEIVAGESACYTLLAFIALKMELHWRANPVGKVLNTLPLSRFMPSQNEFTQNY